MLKLRPFQCSFNQVRNVYKRSNVIKSKTPATVIQHIGAPLITTKRPEFNLHIGDKVDANAEYGSLKLISDGWHHYKSKNDHFTVHPHLAIENEAESTEYEQPFEKFDIHPDLVRNLASRLNIERTKFIQHEAMSSILNNQHTLIGE